VQDLVGAWSKVLQGLVYPAQQHRITDDTGPLFPDDRAGP
jgi:hypothetical protein